MLLPFDDLDSIFEDGSDNESAEYTSDDEAESHVVVANGQRVLTDEFNNAGIGDEVFDDMKIEEPFPCENQLKYAPLRNVPLS